MKRTGSKERTLVRSTVEGQILTVVTITGDVKFQSDEREQQER